MKLTQADITELELSELARAGRLIVQQPFTDIAFRVFHNHDAPGLLLSTIEAMTAEEAPAVGADPADKAKPAGNLQTLATAANGRSLIVRTLTAPVDGVKGGDAITTLDTGRWSGRSRTNPTFLYDSASLIEGVVVLSDDLAPPTEQHAQLMKEAVKTVARAAAKRRLPIVTLQAPSHLPAGDDQWASTVGSAVRFAVAVRRLDVRERMTFLASIVEFCAKQRLGLWLRDPALTARSGNWLPARAFEPAGSGTEADPVTGSLDVTIVGPARVGSTSSILECLQYLTDIGVAACSVAAMNDLAFLHLQLTGAFDNLPDDRAMYVDEFVRGLPAWMGLRPDWWEVEGKGAAPALATMEERAKYYRCMVGPVTTPRGAGGGAETKPVWVSWELAANEDLFALLKGLHDAMGHVARGVKVAQPYNVEYLISRAMPDGRGRGRAKLSVPLDLIKGAVKDELALPVLGKEFCSLVENIWQTEMKASHGATPTDLTVAWREYWLGHWTSEV